MYLAAQLENAALAQMLLENGANPNSENYQGQTPLSAASFLNRHEVAQILLKGGARVSENCSCHRRIADHSMMLFRTEIHILAKQLIDTSIGFRSVFLLERKQNEYCTLQAQRQNRRLMCDYLVSWS